jgi:hypothetical protein
MMHTKSYGSPSELSCTLLSYAAPYLSYAEAEDHGRRNKMIWSWNRISWKVKLKSWMRRNKMSGSWNEYQKVELNGWKVGAKTYRR